MRSTTTLKPPAFRIVLLLVGLLGIIVLAACDSAGTSEQRVLNAAAQAAIDDTPTPWGTGTVTTTATVTGTVTVSATQSATLTATATATGAVSGTTTVTPQATGTSGRKVTICHATGSQRNPYVEITVDENALPAHQRHGDIIPAPAGGCPGSATGTPAATGTPGMTSTPMMTSTMGATGTPAVTSTAAVNLKVNVCHHTSSAQNPYVLISIDQSAVPAHTAHGDMIPAPAGGCPTAQVQQPGTKKSTAPAQQPNTKKSTAPAQQPSTKNNNKPANPGNGNGNGNANSQQNNPGKSEEPKAKENPAPKQDDDNGNSNDKGNSDKGSKGGKK